MTLPPDVTDSNKIQQPPTPTSPPAAVPNQLDTSKPKDSPIDDLVDSPESESEPNSTHCAVPRQWRWQCSSLCALLPSAEYSL